VLDKARLRFNSLTLKPFNEAKESLPYQYQERTQANVTQEDLHNLFKQRRSVRWYEQKPVDIALLSQAINMASQAPSACNRQPFQFYTITDMDKASDIASIAMGTTGFSDNIPALIAVVGDLSAYPAERDRHVIYIDGGLASMQLMLAFETLGLSSCPINWPDIEICERKIAKKLNLATHLRPIMLISVGYGDAKGQIPFSQKKGASTLIKEVS
jgi:nitroreductase